jgi:hypothetical protein
MARYLRSGIAVLFLVCFVSQACCHLETVKVLNHADTHKYQGCDSLLKAGYNASGVYRLTLDGRDVQIQCKFVGGKAIALILFRDNDDANFEVPWSYYEDGVGDTKYNYFVGLKTVFALTSGGFTTLIITVRDWAGKSRYAQYDGFYIDGPSTNYTIHPGKFTGDLPDDLSYVDNMPFATFDRPDPNGCASSTKAGWWYNNCAYALPTGKRYIGGWYTPTGVPDGIYWKDWHGYNYSVSEVVMALASLP